MCTFRCCKWINLNFAYKRQQSTINNNIIKHQINGFEFNFVGTNEKCKQHKVYDRDRQRKMIE